MIQAAVVRRVTSVIAASVAVLVALIGLASCGGQAGGGSGSSSLAAPAAGTAATIVIKSFTFGPDTLTVGPGSVVTVDNQDGAAHTATATDKSFDTGNIAGGQKGSFTAPTTPGRYSYLCTIHQYMKATLVVQ